MRTSLDNFDVHEKIVIDHAGQKISGTALQLLLHIDKGAKFNSIIKDFIRSIRAHYRLEDNIEDTFSGNTYAHLLTRSNIFFGANEKLTACKNHLGQTILHLAAQYASKKILEDILSHTNDVDVVDIKGRTALFYAIEGDMGDNLQLLIEKNANLNHYDYERITPLLHACRHQSVSMARILLKAGANPDLVGTNNRVAPLFLAVQGESGAMALTLIVHGANCEIKDGKGTPVVHLLAALDKQQLLRLFGAKGLLATRDNIGRQPIHVAASQGKSDSVMAILASDPEAVDAVIDGDLNEEESKSINGFTPLHLAGMSNDLKTVQTLLDANANQELKSSIGLNVLSSAASASTLELFFPYPLSNNPQHLREALLFDIRNDEVNKMIALYKQGVTVNSSLIEGLSGLHLACQFGAVQCTQWLLQNGADPSLVCTSGETAFEIAAANNSYEQFCFLLEYTDVDVNYVNNRGETLMHIAAKKGNLHHIILLILHGGNCEETDAKGFTPLHYAALEGHHQVVQILLLCGANIPSEAILDEMQDDKTKEAFHDHLNLLKTAKKGASALHMAVINQNPLALLLLIQLQDIDQQDEEGTSALHLAVQTGQIACIKHLIQAGASVDLQDHLGRTALYYAFEKNNFAVAEALIEAGADLEIKDRTGLSIRKQVLKGIFGQKEKFLRLLEKKSLKSQKQPQSKRKKTKEYQIHGEEYQNEQIELSNLLTRFGGPLFSPPELADLDKSAITVKSIRAMDRQHRRHMSQYPQDFQEAIKADQALFNQPKTTQASSGDVWSALRFAGEFVGLDMIAAIAGCISKKLFGTQETQLPTTNQTNCLHVNIHFLI